MRAEIRLTDFSDRQRWIGRILSALPVLFLAVDIVGKLTGFAPYVESTLKLGFPVSTMLGMALAELACVVLYVVPRTSFLGAVLLTGFLGGATAAHVRLADPLFSHVLAPTYVATLAWAGLALRDWRLRNLMLIPAR